MNRRSRSEQCSVRLLVQVAVGDGVAAVDLVAAGKEALVDLDEVAGAFEHPAVCAELLGVPAVQRRSKPQEYDRLADWFAEHVRHVDALGL